MIQLVTTEEPPWARKGMAMPVSGIRPVTPCGDDEHLEREDRGESGGEEAAEGVAQRESGAETAGD